MKFCQWALLVSLCLSVFGCEQPQKAQDNGNNPALSNAIENTVTMESSAEADDLTVSAQSDPTYQQYIDFFEEVYSTMVENYYQPVSREDFDRFIQLFNTKIYAQLKQSGKSIDFVRWRSAAFLIDHLKSEEDIFSAFYPPKPAKEYEQTALGKRIDLGIEGQKVDNGFLASDVEIRSDAFIKGLRPGHIIYKINGEDILDLSKSDIIQLLKPLEGESVLLSYFDESQQPREIEAVSKEYFKQMTDIIPTKMAGVYGLKVKRFNRKTAEDMLRYLQFFKEEQPNGPMIGLILDLRDNPGGPPLAAREISSFFLTPGEVLTFFKKHDQDRIELDVPSIPEEFHVRVPMVILIDHNCGSAAEMFSGIMQRRGRAILMGENSAGQVMLKSMFHFDDESMLLLITQRGHYPEGDPYSFSGLVPNRYSAQMNGEDIVDYASKYLVYIDRQQ